MALTPAAADLQALRDAILSGDLAEDGRLLPERALAQALQISRSQVRGVLEDLAQEGRIYRRQGQGTFLRPPPAPGAERLGGLARRTSPGDLMEVRLALEPELAALAADRGSAADKAQLLRLRDATQRAPDLRSYERADDMFHYKIAEMARNAVFLTLFEEIRSLRQAADWTEARQAALGPRQISEISRQHSALADAICTGAPEIARQAMRDHLDHVGHMLRQARQT